MLTIRMTRTGKKNRPYFRIVLTDSRRGSKSGGYIEVLGTRDPIKKNTELNSERIKYWISKGAQTSDSVYNMLITSKIIEGSKIDVSSKKPSKKKVEKKKETSVEVPAVDPVAKESAVENKTGDNSKTDVSSESDGEITDEKKKGSDSNMSEEVSKKETEVNAKNKEEIKKENN